MRVCVCMRAAKVANHVQFHAPMGKPRVPFGTQLQVSHGHTDTRRERETHTDRDKDTEAHIKVMHNFNNQNCDTGAADALAHHRDDGRPA